jgi:PAS domain S-box-containing protein
MEHEPGVVGPIDRKPTYEELLAKVAQCEQQQQQQQRDDSLARLHALSARLISQDELRTLLQAVIDAAIDLTGAEKGTLQLYDEASQSLRIVAHRGFEPPFLDHFSVVHDGPAVCGEALRRRERVVVEDVHVSPIFVSTPTMAVMQAAHVRAVQSTPMNARDGHLLGMIATHWTTPHRPSEATLQLLDLLAREAADLVEDRQREEALQQSEERLRRLTDNLPDSAVYQFVHEPDGSRRFLYFSAGIERLCGVRVDDVLRDAGTLHRQSPPECIDRLIEAEARSKRDLSDFDMELPMRRPDGQVRWMRLHSRPRRLPDGRTLWDGVQIDVTERKRAEEALRQSEQRLLGVLESMPEAFVSFDANLRYTYVNANAERLQSARREELLGRNARTVYPDAESAKTISQYERVLREQTTVTSTSYHAGFDKWVEVRAFPTPDGVSVFYQDVSAQVTAQDALRESEARLRSIAKAGSIAFFEWNPEKGTPYWSPEHYELFGYEPGSPVSWQRWQQSLHPEDRERVLGSAARLLDRARSEGRVQGHRDEYRITRSDGTTVWLESNLSAEAKGGEVVFRGSVREITERKQAEEALRVSEQRFRLLVEQAVDGIFVSDAAGHYSDVNAAGCQMLGYTREEILVRGIADVIDQAEVPRIGLEVARFASGQVVTSEWRFRRKDGSSFIGEVVGRQLPEGHLQAILRDVTARKLVETRLALRNALTSTLADAARIDDAVPRVLELLCAHLGWAGGEMWLVDPTTDRLGRSCVWHVPDTSLDDVVAQGAGLALARGEGFPGSVWARGEPVWFSDLAEVPEYPRRAASEHAGLRSLFAFPLRVGAEVLGVALLADTAVHERDAAFVELAEALGSQVGQFIQRKRAEEALRRSEERWNAALEKFRAGAIIATEAEQVIYWNPAARAMHGFTSADEGVGPLRETPNTFELWTPDGQRLLPLDEWPMRRIKRGETVRDFELRLRRPDQGWERIVSYSGAMVATASGERLIFVSVHDLTEQRRAEAALREANLRLVEADRRKDEFLAVLSHELRGPLAPVRNSVFVLEHASPGGAQATRALEIIERQSAHLSRLVDDLLDLNRISRGKIQLDRRRCDLVELVRSTVEDQRAVFINRGVGLHAEAPRVPLWLEADPTRIAQVLGNLLGNAGKFTPQGGSVRVIVHVEQRQAVVRVCDTGVGIAPELLGRIFDPFTQAEQTLARSQGGLGLGLALVKGFVEMHGGSVSVHSDGPGRGAEFTIRLPLLERVVAGESRPTAVGATARSLRVLVIEDNRDAAGSLAEVLGFLGHEASAVFDGAAGVAAARATRPDLVLCDIGLPDISGYEVARELRADAQLGSCTLVALTGYAQPEDLAKAKEAGFHSHLAKPPSLERLRELLSEVARER